MMEVAETLKEELQIKFPKHDVVIRKSGFHINYYHVIITSTTTVYAAVYFAATSIALDCYRSNRRFYLAVDYEDPDGIGHIINTIDKHFANNIDLDQYK